MVRKNILLSLFILFVIVNLSNAQVAIGKKEIIYSKILNEERTYQIYLPASYLWASDRNYPVIYVLDGESNYLHTVSSTSFLSSKGEIPELIIVAITSTVRIRDYTQTDWSSHWIGGGGAKNFKSFLSGELIPNIEKEYRTNGYRIISGHSAAGQFVLYTLTSEPTLFNAYFAISPSLDWDNNLPQRSLEESLIKTDSLRSFLYVARSDDAGQVLADYMILVETLESKSPKGFRWISKAFPDETHSSIPLLAIIDAVRQLFNGYRLHNDLLVNGIKFAEEHFQKVSEKVGYTIPVPEEVINNYGYEELEKGNIQTAIDFFKRNIEQNPNSANAYDGLADGYEKAGMWKEAIEASNKAVALADKYNDSNLSYYIDHAKKIKDKSKLGSEE